MHRSNGSFARVLRLASACAAALGAHVQCADAQQLPEPAASASPAATATPTASPVPRVLGLRGSLDASLTSIDQSTDGPGQIGPETQGFIAGSPLAPNTPYDLFSSAPASAGHRRTSAGDRHGNVWLRTLRCERSRWLRLRERQRDERPRFGVNRFSQPSIRISVRRRYPMRSCSRRTPVKMTRVCSARRSSADRSRRRMATSACAAAISISRRPIASRSRNRRSRA